MLPPEMKRLKLLEDENGRLKRIVADLSLDKEMWPVPGFEDTELGVFMEPEVDHGTTEVYAGVQA